jgi:hypothetical protein
LTVTLVLPSQTETVNGEPRVVRTLQGALGGLGAMLQVALDALIYVAVYALPVVPFALVYWWWWRGRRPSAAAASAPTGGAM